MDVRLRRAVQRFQYIFTIADAVALGQTGSTYIKFGGVATDSCESKSCL